MNNNMLAGITQFANNTALDDWERRNPALDTYAAYRQLLNAPTSAFGRVRDYPGNDFEIVGITKPRLIEPRLVREIKEIETIAVVFERTIVRFNNNLEIKSLTDFDKKISLEKPVLYIEGAIRILRYEYDLHKLRELLSRDLKIKPSDFRTLDTSYNKLI